MPLVKNPASADNNGNTFFIKQPAEILNNIMYLIRIVLIITSAFGLTED